MCEGKVANFLQCYHDMVKISKSDMCSESYMKAFVCLKNNLNNNEENDCGYLLDDFAKCK